MATLQGIVELHLLQNFAPANLNRDDTNTPKTCEFGGHRRARISSQCLKRAIRWHPGFQETLGASLGVRTKRLLQELEAALRTQGVRAEDIAAVLPVVGQHLFVGVDPKAGGKTQVLLFLGRDEIARMADIVWKHLGALKAAAGSGAAEKKPAAKGKKAEDPLAAFRTALQQCCVDGRRSADVALFGRMVAESPSHNVDAAAQVAHAISTNRVSVEFDFFTAVDDLQRDEEPGAGMMGTVEYDSACFYRYALVHLRQLEDNLKGDADLAVRAVRAFLCGAIEAVPTGKQNSFAAYNPPSLVLATLRTAGAWSLANAFIKPVVPTREEDLVTASVRALDGYWGKLVAAYGGASIRAAAVCCLDDGLEALRAYRVAKVQEVVDRIAHAVEEGAK